MDQGKSLDCSKETEKNKFFDESFYTLYFVNFSFIIKSSLHILLLKGFVSAALSLPSSGSILKLKSGTSERYQPLSIQQ
jgi:hypothetical protein